jgi:hypothetical protein
MAIAHAMWTHGHSLQVEIPTKGNVERKGFSAKYTSNSGASPNWLHFAVPTPVIVNDARLKVESVLVRFRCGGSGRVKAIHIYDGENKIAGKDNLNLGPTQWHVERLDVPGTPKVEWGLGISILVDFGPDDRWVEFSAAGCDFL